MARIDTVVKMTNVYSFERRAIAYWSTETAYIYTMTGEDGTVYVWKTTAVMGFEEPTDDPTGYTIDGKEGRWQWVACNKGDVIRIRATIKGESEYKGMPQTEVNRVKVMERIERALTREEREEMKREEQLASINEGDIIMTMPYRNYKDHYSDCETLAGSFIRSDYDAPTIDVIVRKGRLVPSGVRGQSFSGYEIKYKMDGIVGSVVYRAVCEDNAVKRFQKSCPDATIINIYEC